MDLHQWHNDIIGEKVVKALKKNNFDAVYFQKREDAVNHVLSFISAGKTLGVGGSATVTELGLVERAGEKGAKILDHHAPELTAEEKLEVRRQQLTSDVFLCSTNALTLDGALVNVDGAGNRVAAMTFGPKRVVVVTGINKVCEDIHSAYERIRLIAAPINNKRLEYPNPCVETGVCTDCQGDTRICNIYSVLKKRPRITDYSVVVIGETLGF